MLLLVKVQNPLLSLNCPWPYYLQGRSSLATNMVQTWYMAKSVGYLQLPHCFEPATSWAHSACCTGSWTPTSTRRTWSWHRSAETRAAF